MHRQALIIFDEFVKQKNYLSIFYLFSDHSRVLFHLYVLSIFCFAPVMSLEMMLFIAIGCEILPVLSTNREKNRQSNKSCAPRIPIFIKGKKSGQKIMPQPFQSDFYGKSRKSKANSSSNGNLFRF